MYKSSYINSMIKRVNDYNLGAYNPLEKEKEKEKEIRKRYSEEIAAQKIMEFKREFEATKEQLFKTLSRMKDTEVAKYEKAYNEQFSGSKLHEDINILNQPFINLSQEELQLLADRHKDNALMVRAFRNYADTKGIHITTYNNTPEEKIKAVVSVYDHAMSYYNNGLSWAIMEDTGFKTQDQTLSK